MSSPRMHNMNDTEVQGSHNNRIHNEETSQYVDAQCHVRNIHYFAFCLRTYGISPRYSSGAGQVFSLLL